MEDKLIPASCIDAQAEDSSSPERRRAALKKLAASCNELVVVDFAFYLRNPRHYDDEQNWLVAQQEKAPSKHTAMANGAVSLPCALCHHCIRSQTAHGSLSTNRQCICSDLQTWHGRAGLYNCKEETWESFIAQSLALSYAA